MDVHCYASSGITHMTDHTKVNTLALAARLLVNKAGPRGTGVSLAEAMPVVITRQRARA